MFLDSTDTVTGVKTFGAAGNVWKLKVAGATSGSATIDAPAVAWSAVITLPWVTSTLSTLTGTETLTNKTINLWSNTVSWTKAQFDTACTDDNFAYLGQAQTYTATQTFNSSPRLWADDLPLYMSTANAWYIRWWNSWYIAIQWNSSWSWDKNVYIETPQDLVVKSQNRTSWWTSWTPTRVGWTAWTLTVISASYKQVWKNVFWRMHISFDTTWSYTNFVSFTAPVSQWWGIASCSTRAAVSTTSYSTSWYVNSNQVYIEFEATMLTTSSYWIVMWWVYDAS